MERLLLGGLPRASATASVASSLYLRVRFQIVVPRASRSRLLFATAEVGMFSILSMLRRIGSARAGSSQNALESVFSSFTEKARCLVRLSKAAWSCIERLQSGFLLSTLSSRLLFFSSALVTSAIDNGRSVSRDVAKGGF